MIARFSVIDCPLFETSFDNMTANKDNTKSMPRSISVNNNITPRRSSGIFSPNHDNRSPVIASADGNDEVGVKPVGGVAFNVPAGFSCMVEHPKGDGRRT